MSFKIKPPYIIDNTPIYNYPMDEEGVLGKANRNGTILINKDLHPSKAKEVEEHEMGHIDQMKRGDLDYDDKNVYWKGKTYPRSKMNEGAHNLPWEKEIYDKTEKNKKMGFKLDGHRGKSSPFANLVKKGLISPLNNNGDENKVVAGNKNKGMLEEVEITASRPEQPKVNIGRNYIGKYVREGADVQPSADYRRGLADYIATTPGYEGFQDRQAELRRSGNTEDYKQAEAGLREAKMDFNTTDQGKKLANAVKENTITSKKLNVRESDLAKYGFGD